MAAARSASICRRSAASASSTPTCAARAFSAPTSTTRTSGCNPSSTSSTGWSRKHGCYGVESIPSRGWWYGRIVRCIDKKTYLPERTEYYDRSGVLWKVRTLADVKKIGGYPTATTITMQTVPQHTATTITLSDVQYDTGLPDSLFTGP